MSTALRPFERSAGVYDLVYAARGKDYVAETARLRAIIRQYAGDAPRTLLDVACGTGEHLACLHDDFDVTGMDASPAMLDVARSKLEGVPFHEADMRTFDLGRRFDVVTCLFSSIAYLDTTEDLADAVGRLAAHVAPRGLLIIEPGILPSRLAKPHPQENVANGDGVRVERRTTASVEDERLVIRFAYTIARGTTLVSFDEEHSMALFDDLDYRGALAGAGLTVDFIDHGMTTRGVYVAR
ncbi:MAG: class I SAM-dependent methyltransferase [Planctomycetota bacterium]|jgi:SAM-dependent methyltransferase